MLFDKHGENCVSPGLTDILLNSFERTTLELTFLQSANRHTDTASAPFHATASVSTRPTPCIHASPLRAPTWP